MASPVMTRNSLHPTSTTISRPQLTIQIPITNLTSDFATAVAQNSLPSRRPVPARYHRQRQSLADQTQSQGASSSATSLTYSPVRSVVPSHVSSSSSSRPALPKADHSVGRPTAYPVYAHPVAETMARPIRATPTGSFGLPNPRDTIDVIEAKEKRQRKEDLKEYRKQMRKEGKRKFRALVKAVLGDWEERARKEREKVALHEERVARLMEEEERTGQPLTGPYNVSAYRRWS